MSVEFDEPQSNSMGRPPKAPSSLISMVIRTGIVKTTLGAQVVLFVIAVLLIICAVYLFQRANAPLPTPTPEQVAL